MIECKAKISTSDLIIQDEKTIVMALRNIDPYIYLVEDNIHGWTFRLMPFIKNMLTDYAVDEMKKGLSYQFSGTELGYFREGALGHPGDGEYDVYIIKHVNIDITFSTTQITMLISGKTEKGYGTIWYATPNPEWSTRYPFINFEVEIPIPIGQDMQELLGCSEPFIEKLKQC